MVLLTAVRLRQPVFHRQVEAHPAETAAIPAAVRRGQALLGELPFPDKERFVHTGAQVIPGQRVLGIDEALRVLRRVKARLPECLEPALKAHLISPAVYTAAYVLRLPQYSSELPIDS